MKLALPLLLLVSACTGSDTGPPAGTGSGDADDTAATDDDTASTDDTGEPVTDADGDGALSWRVAEDPATADCDDDDPGVGPDTERYLPAGAYWRGDEGFPEATPVLEVTLSPFCVDVLEVTNDDFVIWLDALVEAGHPRETEAGAAVYDFDDDDDEVPQRIVDVGGDTYEIEAGYGDHPVVEVYFRGAEGYCAERGKVVPTEAQWEGAARGGEDDRIWPWGDEEPGCDHGNIRPGPEGVDENGQGVDPCVDDTVPVGSYPDGIALSGAYDMAGNAAEWVRDWFSPDYYAEGSTEDPQGPEEPELFEGPTGDYYARVSKGGGFGTGIDATRIGFRYIEPDDGASNGMGFRCVRELVY